MQEIDALAFLVHLINRGLPCGNGTDTAPIINNEYIFNVNLPPMSHKNKQDLSNSLESALKGILSIIKRASSLGLMLIVI